MISDEMPEDTGDTPAETERERLQRAAYGPNPHPGVAVLELDKGNIEFWVEIAQLIVLLLILREVMRNAR